MLSYVFTLLPVFLSENEWLGAGVVICLERGADLQTAQLMPLPLTVSCSSKIQIGFTFLVPAHLGSPGKRAVKRVLYLKMRVAKRVVSLDGLSLKTTERKRSHSDSLS